MLCLPPPSAIFFCISKGKLCQSASLACLDEARNTIFAGTNPRYTAWKGAQRSRCFEQVMQMPPKPVSWAHSESPPQTLLPYSTPSIFPRAPAEHSVERKFGSFKRNKFWPCEDLHHVPLECAPFVQARKNWKCLWFLHPVRTTAPYTHHFSGLQAIKIISILTCRDGLCRGPLRPHCFGCCSSTSKASKELTALWNTSQTSTRRPRCGK